MSKRRVIINGDDFGRSPGVNLGIARAHEHGVVKSASLMVRWPAARVAADYARAHPQLDVGLHLDFGEWGLRGGEWVPIYQVVDTWDRQAVADEIARQLDEFFALMGRLPTHLDSHQHRHLREPIRSLLCETGARHGMAVRGISVAYCGRFYGQDSNGVPHAEWISLRALLSLLSGLQADVTELSCHPAAIADLDTMYNEERVLELETLCDPELPQAIAELALELVSFREIGPAGTQAASSAGPAAR